MTTATREEIVRWMIEVDDPLDMLRVNWQRHDPFTQNGMWNVTDETMIAGIRLMMDRGEFKGYLLQVEELDQNVITFVVIATYGDKCQECGAQPHDSNWYPGETYSDDGLFDDLAIDMWAVGQVHGMWENAENGIEVGHFEGCANGALLMEGDEDSEVADGSTPTE